MELPSALARDRVHVFVAGPGIGEGCAIALPNGEWILIDGCETRPESGVEHPLRMLVERFGKNHSSVSHLILTHPHADHVYGFIDLIEELSPDYIGVTGPDPQKNLARELGLDPPSEATSALTRRRRVKTALARIQAWSEQHPGHLCSLCSGVSLQLRDAGTLEVVTRAPDAAVLSTWWSDGTLPRMIRDDTNALSIVLELRWGATRLLFGGDLPSDGQTGWRRVHQADPRIARPHVFKLPHHGSRGALYEPVLGRPGDEAAWIVTPFSPSQLPRADVDDGLDRLLALQSPVHLTAMSMSKRLQAAIDRDEVEADQLVAIRDALLQKGFFNDEREHVLAGTGVGGLDPIWHVEIDEAGTICSRHHGRASLAVYRAQR